MIDPRPLQRPGVFRLGACSPPSREEEIYGTGFHGAKVGVGSLAVRAFS
jgi:hypothetical protein